MLRRISEHPDEERTSPEVSPEASAEASAEDEAADESSRGGRTRSNSESPLDAAGSGWSNSESPLDAPVEQHVLGGAPPSLDSRRDSGWSSGCPIADAAPVSSPRELAPASTAASITSQSTGSRRDEENQNSATADRASAELGSSSMTAVLPPASKVGDSRAPADESASREVDTAATGKNPELVGVIAGEDGCRTGVVDCRTDGAASAASDPSAGCADENGGNSVQAADVVLEEAALGPVPGQTGRDEQLPPTPCPPDCRNSGTRERVSAPGPGFSEQGPADACTPADADQVQEVRLEDGLGPVAGDLPAAAGHRETDGRPAARRETAVPLPLPAETVPSPAAEGVSSSRSSTSSRASMPPLQLCPPGAAGPAPASTTVSTPRMDLTLPGVERGRGRGREPTNEQSGRRGKSGWECCIARDRRYRYCSSVVLFGAIAM